MAFGLADAFSAMQGTPPQIPDASGITDALARNQQLGAIRQVVQQAMGQAPQQSIPQQAPQQRHGLFGGGGLGNVLGRIGDALLEANGISPIYGPRVENRKIGAAVANYLGNSDSALAAIFEQNPEVGLKLYQYRHPTNDSLPEIVRDYQYYKTLPDAEKPAFEKIVQTMHPGMIAPITLGPGDTYDAGGGAPASGGSLPHVTDQATYDAVPNGAQYTTPDGNIRTKGGATASSPSPTFR